jgi:uncharacterized Zn finger protein (UPF0148 family)
MGIVVQETCPQCKQSLYIPLDCAKVRCPHCHKADVINKRRKNPKKNSLHQKNEDKRYVFQTLNTQVKTCPKCGTKFSSSSVLTKGKLFCPHCNNPISLND